MEAHSAARRRLIAAQQVSVTLDDVTKELVDNALDAGAENISVEIGCFSIQQGASEQDGQPRLQVTIEVSDDGSGFASHADLSRACSQHCTSKLQSVDQLRSLDARADATLGFRGEALFGISSLSAATAIWTRLRGEGSRAPGSQGASEVGGGGGACALFASDGSAVHTAAVPRQRGTVVLVAGIFHHLPVREKILLRQLSSQVQSTARRLEHYAVARGAVRFSLVRSRGAPATGSLANLLLDRAAGVSGSSAFESLRKFCREWLGGLPVEEARNCSRLLQSSGQSPSLLAAARSVLKLKGELVDFATTVEQPATVSPTGPSAGPFMRVEGVVSCALAGRSSGDVQLTVLSGRPVDTPGALKRRVNEVFRECCSSNKFPAFVLRLTPLSGDVADISGDKAKRSMLVRWEALVVDAVADAVRRVLSGSPSDEAADAGARAPEHVSAALGAGSRPTKRSASKVQSALRDLLGGCVSRPASASVHVPPRGQAGALGQANECENFLSGFRAADEAVATRAAVEWQDEVEEVPTEGEEEGDEAGEENEAETQAGEEEDDGSGEGTDAEEEEEAGAQAGEEEENGTGQGTEAEEEEEAKIEAGEEEEYGTGEEDEAEEEEEADTGAGEDEEDGTGAEEENEGDVNEAHGDECERDGEIDSRSRKRACAASIGVRTSRDQSTLVPPKAACQSPDAFAPSPVPSPCQPSQADTWIQDLGGCSCAHDELESSDDGLDLASDFEEGHEEVGAEHGGPSGFKLPVSNTAVELIPTRRSSLVGQATFSPVVGVVNLTDEADDEGEDDEEAQPPRLTYLTVPVAAHAGPLPARLGRAFRSCMSLRRGWEAESQGLDSQASADGGQQNADLLEFLGVPSAAVTREAVHGLPPSRTAPAIDFSKDEFARLRVIGQFNLGFILAARDVPDNAQDERSCDVFIVDQHASDEKRRFELLSAASRGLRRQPLIVPLSLRLSPAQELVAENHQQTLEWNGFSVRVRPDDAPEDAAADSAVSAPLPRLELLSCPLDVDGKQLGMEDLSELLLQLEDAGAADRCRRQFFAAPSAALNASAAALDAGSPEAQEGTGVSAGLLPRPRRLWAALANRSCRSAIMVGTPLSLGRMKAQVEAMAGLAQPWNCPHGRPTMRYLASF